MLSKAKSDLSQSPKLSVGREQCDGGPRGYKVKAPRSMVCFWNQGECSFPTANSGILGVVWGWGGFTRLYTVAPFGPRTPQTGSLPERARERGTCSRFSEHVPQASGNFIAKSLRSHGILVV